jgi:hypothetical protein
MELFEAAKHEHEHPALFDERATLEGFSPDQLRDFIEECGIKATKLEQYMHMANDVLDGYGL